MKFMEVQAGSEVSLGMAPMSVDSRDDRSVPEWIMRSVMPYAHEDQKPLLDIYAQILKLHDTLELISADVQYLVAESQRRHMQPHRRFWRWIKAFLTERF